MLDNKTYWIEVFKTGSFTDANGIEFDCDINKLNEIAKTYNEAISTNDTLKAPVVKGHPESNDPAFGWVKSLKVEGDTLFAELYDMDLNFVNEVKDKKYQKVSISLYDDLMLRHVGFLGAVPPAVKGMENVSFSEIEGKKITNLCSFNADLNTEKENVLETELYNFTIQENTKYKRSKPDRFKEYRADEFADPTHFRFPIRTKSDVRASLAIFSRKESRSEYSDSERQLIAARLVTAMEYHGIKRNTKIWKYNEEKQVISFSNIEVPVDMLSKVQLKAVIQSILEAKATEDINNNNDLTINLGEVVMDPQLFKAYQDFVVSFIAKTVDEATATAFQAESDAWLTQNVQQTDPNTATDPNATPAVTASEQAMADQIKASAEEIAKLKSDLQDKDFNEYLANQTNLTPVMANKLKPLLKATAEYDSASKAPLQFN
ncbi:MAG: hypothetical protein NTW25_00545, partial [Candidatus Kapabacteria bacterium]|nr:hypothetical protein [Candidatus Kapabacteria bacterium]